MSEFVGRTGSHRVYSYPESRRGGVLSLARNFAYGPEETTAIAAALGTQVPWEQIESGVVAGVNVPITPRSSGIVKISGVIVVESSSDAEEIVTLQVEGGPLDTPLLVPLSQKNTIAPVAEDLGYEAIPFSTIAAPLLVGSLVNIKIRLIASTGDVLSFRAGSSTIHLQEVVPATG